MKRHIVLLCVLVFALLLTGCGKKHEHTWKEANCTEKGEQYRTCKLCGNRETKEIPNKNTRLREAIDFADMVIQYVNDGSGTKDLIDRARTRLEEALKTL